MQDILTSGINEANAEQAKRIVAEQYAALNAREFQAWADANRLPSAKGKKATLTAIERFIDNQLVLHVQTECYR